MKRMNDHNISAEVKEGPADCVRMAEVRAVLKKMKRHKAPGLSGLVAEMIEATGDIGTQWILDLCNDIVKEGSIAEDWKSSVVLPIYKGKGDATECGSCRGIKLLSLTYKVLTTTQPSYLHNLITVQPPRSTRSSSLVTLSRPSTSSSLRITDRSFQYASPRLWNQLPAPLRQPRTNLSNSASPSSSSGTSSHQFHRLTSLIIHHPFTFSLQA